VTLQLRDTTRGDPDEDHLLIVDGAASRS